jgi:hypothetical protein
MVRSMSEGIVARYMKAATHDMIQNNQTEIKCPCKRCKLKCYVDPYSGVLQSHLLSRGFMDGYTRWISDEDADNMHGAATGNNEEGHGGDHKDSPRHDDAREDAGHSEEDEDAGQSQDDQDAEHGEEDQDAGHGGGEEDQDAGEGGTPLGSWVQNPYVQALLLKQTSNARDTAREKAKLVSLEK